jgi:hypothetical protein
MKPVKLETPFTNKSIILRRKQQGQQLVELSAGLIILVPIFFLIIDLSVAYLAANFNDDACREACRAASSVTPANSDNSGNVSSTSPIYQRAESVIKKVQHLDGYIIGPRLIAVDLSPDFKRPANLLLGGNFEGSVTVRSQIDYRVPASIPGLLPSSVTLDAQQSFPLTAIMRSQITPL